MSNWIDLSALWRIVAGALICGAGLPALFAVGLRALHLGAPREPAIAGATEGTDAGGDRLVGGNPIGAVAASVCFLVVLAAIAWGIYLIVNGSHH